MKTTLKNILFALYVGFIVAGFGWMGGALFSPGKVIDTSDAMLLQLAAIFVMGVAMWILLYPKFIKSENKTKTPYHVAVHIGIVVPVILWLVISLSSTNQVVNTSVGMITGLSVLCIMLFLCILFIYPKLNKYELKHKK